MCMYVYQIFYIHTTVDVLLEVQPVLRVLREQVAALRRGLLNNLLNPKVGIFYVSFLPQFMPVGVDPARFGLLLTTIHVVEGLLWFALLIAATVPIAGLLRLPVVVRWLDRTTGLVFVAFGLRLALERR